MQSHVVAARTGLRPEARRQQRRGRLGRRSRCMLALIVAVVFILRSFTKQMKKVDAAEEAGVFGDQKPEEPKSSDRPPTSRPRATRPEPAGARQSRRTRRTRQSQAVSAESSRCPSATSRATRSARCTSNARPPRSLSTSSAVISTAGSVGPPTPSVKLSEVVADPQERPAGADRVVGVAHRGATLRGRELEVGHQAHVVRRIAPPRRGVRAHPRDVERLGQRPPLVETGLGEVDGGDLPALPSQPDRVATLPAGEVERPAGREPRQLRLDELVRPGRPHELARAVALVPRLGIHASHSHRSPRGEVSRSQSSHTAVAPVVFTEPFCSPVRRTRQNPSFEGAPVFLTAARACPEVDRVRWIRTTWWPGSTALFRRRH